MSENLIPAPAKYAQLQGDQDLTYDAICKLLSGRQAQVDWGAVSPEDWLILAQVAEAERVAPLLYWELKKAGSGETQWAVERVPAGVWQFLQRSYYQTAARNAVLLAELNRILAAFERAHIPVIVLKGAAIARSLYADPALRPMSDLDFLVRPADLQAAAKTLQGLGYSQEKVTYHAYLRGGPEGQVAAEVHWSLVPDGQGRSPDLDWLWAQTQPFSKGGGQRFARRLLPLAQFVYQTGHLMIQNERSRRQLIWFYDLYLLYQQEIQTADWEAWLHSESLGGWAIWVQTALYQLRDLFGLRLPPSLTDSP